MNIVDTTKEGSIRLSYSLDKGLGPLTEILRSARANLEGRFVTTNGQFDTVLDQYSGNIPWTVGNTRLERKQRYK